jgi:hypothetical protein
MKMKRIRRTYLILAAVISISIPTPVILTVAAAAEQAEHTILAGDDLHLLAGYYYQDPRRWMVIHDANRDLLKDPSVISPGTVLMIPGEGLKPFPIPYSEWRLKVGG